MYGQIVMTWLFQIVHGDLAARNILVFTDHVVKISDFGLSKKLYGSTLYRMKRKVRKSPTRPSDFLVKPINIFKLLLYSQRKLPWRGASIELLLSSEFSECSDVWAFGVTAWEIFTLGQTPYKGKRYGSEFIQFLQEGNRLAKPRNASEQTWVARRFSQFYCSGLSDNCIEYDMISTRFCVNAGILTGTIDPISADSNRHFRTLAPRN